jgi:para-nitrobenzyl esterase
MGESGGGMKVSTLMAMPKAQGLFRHAVVESGSMPIDDFSIEQATDLARKFMDELNISPDNLGKLTELTGAEIMSAYLSLCGKVMSMPFQPVADGINLLYREKGFHTYPWSANIPLMVGSAEDENAIFIPVDEILSVTAENLRGKLLGTSIFSPADGFAGERKINETNVDEILCAFGRHNYKGDSARHLYVKIKSMASFRGMGAFYQTMEKARNGSASVYHYIVAKDTPHLAHQQFARDTASDSRFAWHTAELPLQFGIVYYPEDAAFSEKLRGSLAAFVKTGDPSTPALPWPAITETDRNVMLYDDSCEIRSDPWKEMREALEGGVC